MNLSEFAAFAAAIRPGPLTARRPRHMLPGHDPAKVGAFVIGVQKCGTTTLFHALARHPQLAAPAVKETHFFDDETVDWSAPDYAAFHGFFPPPDPARLRFEATPISSFWPPALARIHAYNPDARLILLVRDPVARAWSHWCMEFARGWEDLPFAEAIRQGRRRLSGADRTAPAWRIYSYIERGRYAAQLARAQALFGTERILLLTLDDLAHRRDAALARIAGFLGIAPFPPLPPLWLNPRPTIAWPALPTAADRCLIRDMLESDMAAFTTMTGIAWPHAPAASP